MIATTAQPSGLRTERPSKPGPNWPLWAGLSVALVITFWSARSIEFTLDPLIYDYDRGRPVLEGFLDPDWAYLDRVVEPFLETFSIAVLASLVGCSLALVMALLASKVSAPNHATYWITKQTLSVIRSLPDVAYGLFFVAAVGTGPLAGILALILFNLGIAAKLTSETIDAIDPGPLEATDAVGAGVIERARVAIVPQVLPSYVSYCLYVFELNIRASVIIGLVGGGGIGSVISVELSRFNFGRLSALIIVLFVVVFALDAGSRALRRRLV
ncbi:MAG: phosphonate ABC transporter, permease protein PhnE [Nocardioides sp.]